MSPLLLLPLGGLALAESSAPATTWSPLRVAIDCQNEGRTRACAFLRGFIDASEVLAYVPRAEAQVVLYVNATARTNDDIVQLRYVSELPSAPPSLELLQTLDTRNPDDEQRASLQPAFLRGMGPFVTAVNPEAVTVSLARPAEGTEVAAKTTPWGVGVYLGGWGSWTEDFQYLSIWDGIWVYRLTTRSRFVAGVAHDAELEAQPSLQVEQHTVSLDSSSSSVGGSLLYGYNLDDHWTVGGLARGGHEDPDGQYLGTARAHAAVERNWFPSDDPRGNRLAATYMLGAQADWYNHTNQLGQDQALYPTHGLMLQGTVRVDTVDLTLELGAGAELLHPLQRYVLSVSGDMDLTLGDHVDLNFNMGLTQQAIPGPTQIDTSSYEAVTRADYAEPLSLWGNLNIRVHWDHTNGERNNRFDALDGLGNTANL